jgi:hypothetical protein
MKGSDERDVMFGRLFGYLAVIRAGALLGKPSTEVLHILDRFIELFKRKAWIREVMAESILYLLESVPLTNEVGPSLVARIKLIAEPGDMPDLSAYQIVLLSGLQRYSANQVLQGHTFLPPLLVSVVPVFPVISAETLPLLTQTLLAACNGFPKVCLDDETLAFKIPFIVSSLSL